MKKLLLLLSAVVIMASCSDDSSTNPSIDDKSFLMTNVGSYWIYETTSYLDEFPPVTYLDSLSLDSKSKLNGTNIHYCTMHSDTNNNGNYEEKVNSNYDFVLGANKLCLTKESFIDNFISFGGEFNVKTVLNWSEEYVRIGDAKSKDWTILSQDVLFELPKHKVKIDGNIKVNVSKVDTTRIINIGNTEYIAYGFELKLDIKGQAEREGFTNPFYPVTYNMETVFWLVDGIGPVLIEKTKLKHTTTNTSATFPIINAKNSVLIRYNNTN